MAAQAPALRVPPATGRRPGRGPVPPTVTLLGGFAVHRGNIELPVPAGARRLVALAALHPNALARPQVAEMLWPDAGERRAAACLRSALSRLRSAVPDLLDRDPGSVRLAEGVEVDARQFDGWAMDLADDVPGVTELDFTLLSRLMIPLLPRWDDQWVHFERVRLRELGLDALEQVAGRLAAERRYARATAVVYQVLRVDPLRESAMCVLIRIHLTRGNQAEAARVYVDFRSRLRAELGIEPSEEMRTLVARLMPKTERNQ